MTRDAGPDSRIPKLGRKTRAFLHSRTAMIGSIGLTLIVLAVVFAGVLSPNDPNDQDVLHPFQGPGWSHPLGTDDLGRDILSRLLHGGQVSLLIAVSVVLLGALIALPIGLFAGYVGGATDNVVMRVMDAGLAFPALVLTLAIVGVLGKGTVNVVLALMIVTVPGFVRLVRGQTLAVSQETYVEASQAIGTPPARMVRRRVFPNVRSPLIVIVALSFGSMLIAEAALSFLGLGAQPPTASWGNMLREAYDYALFTHPWQLFPAAIAILIAVLAFNAIGDGLRDSLGVARHTRARGRIKRGLTTVVRGAWPGPEDFPDVGALLAVRDLRVEFDTERGPVEVLDGISLDINHSEIVGLVGESGSGKTVTAMSIMRLLSSPPGRVTGGSIWFQGRDLLSLSFKEMRKVRGAEIAMVFQDPMTSLDPAFTVGNQLVEAQRLHGRVSRSAARGRAAEMLDLVGIPDARQRLDEYPHQLSGGMRQRAMIAIALVCEPKLLIADEPTTALDVTVQAQILDLFGTLREELRLSVMFVTHDLGVVAEVCDRVVVMYAGQVVEQGSIDTIFTTPEHPYTEGLLRATPHSATRGEELSVIPGSVPPAHLFPAGCRFAPRCSYVRDECATAPVPLGQVSGDGGLSRCLRVGDLHLEGAR